MSLIYDNTYTCFICIINVSIIRVLKSNYFSITYFLQTCVVEAVSTNYLLKSRGLKKILSLGLGLSLKARGSLSPTWQVLRVFFSFPHSHDLTILLPCPLAFMMESNLSPLCNSLTSKAIIVFFPYFCYHSRLWCGSWPRFLSVLATLCSLDLCIISLCS